MSIDKVLIREQELASKNTSTENVFASKNSYTENIFNAGDKEWVRALKPDAKRALGLHFLFGNEDRRRQAGLEWMSPTQAYYNSYYWLLVFAKLHEEQFGIDAGLDQQCDQMLELMPPDVDWAVVEELIKAANPKFLA